MSSDLDTQIRSVFDDIIASTPELGPAPDPELAPVTPIGQRPGRQQWLLGIAAAFLLVVVGGIFVARGPFGGSDPAPVATRPAMPTETIPAPGTIATTAAPSTSTEPATTAAPLTVPPTVAEPTTEPAPETTPAPVTTARPAPPTTTQAPAQPVATTSAPSSSTSTTAVAVVTPVTTAPETTAPLIDIVVMPPMTDEALRDVIDPNNESEDFVVLARADLDGDYDEDAIVAADWCGSSCAQSVDLVLNDFSGPIVYVPAGAAQWEFKTFLPWFVMGGAAQSNVTQATITDAQITLTGTGLCGEAPVSDVDTPGMCNYETVRTATYSFVDGVVAPVSIDPPLG